ncbi:MAG TPA: type ISP restriction/modification enzyme [Patescibacteria group bacterium]|nr:type ISP restriction/modification enzyme [Patescibacteria group bacterium]
MFNSIIENYLKDIHRVYTRGDAREESYYSDLKKFIEELRTACGQMRIAVTTLPRKTEGGNPDFRIWDGKNKIVGYIETKKPETDLDDVENSEQIKRYQATFPNFILTNFLEFRLFHNGEVIGRTFIGRQHTLAKLGARPVAENSEELKSIFERFFSYSFPRNLNAKRLAQELAKRTRFLRDQVLAEELKARDENGHNQILGFYEAFKTYLISGLSENEFNDLYAQTITYGLFAARIRAREGEFTRRSAIEYIPRTVGILHDVFQFISLGQPPVQLEWIIDDIAEVLASVDVSIILNEFYQQGKGEDPILHFYETFLNEYDPKTRERRGVYYTPTAVVSFIVRSLDNVLKEEFTRPDGLADRSVKVLDPAAGTLTFIAEACRLAFKNYTTQYGNGTASDFIRSHLLKNFYAFELMMAPYAIGHLKMSYILEEMGYRLDAEHERFPLYLTNTLEMEEIGQSNLPGIATLAEESRQAGKIKKETPILVILGNPPYSGISTNTGDWIVELIEKYKYVDGQHFGEKKHWLQDDYVKFIRFSQWKIDQAGEGCIGLITNNGYLDNPTFRGMRQSLMESFQEIFILNLHGNSNKKEKCPDGSIDKNVFDIRQGVCITLFIKKKNIQSETKIFYADLWGLREDKYKWLEENDLKTVSWKQLQPTTPYYFFIPQNIRYEKGYSKFIKISDIFPVNVTGIVTAHDDFVIDFNKRDLVTRINLFLDKNLSDEYVQQSLDLKENYMWRVSTARKQLMEVENPEKYFNKILYRPFDIRNIFFHESVVWRTRNKIMRNMLKENISLCFMRQVSIDNIYSHFFVSSNIIDNRTFYSSKGIIQQAPLYLYPEKEKKTLFNDTGRQPNIDPKIFDMIVREGFKTVPTPEQIFYYIYAVLYANIYRKKYAEFLKSDFPRIPFTGDKSLFKEMAKLGEELAAIHLLKSPQLDKTISKFEISGDNVVKKVQYCLTGTKQGSPATSTRGLSPLLDIKTGNVFINDSQYFSNIPPDVWEYQIGGYQVMAKWLKDRKGRALSLDDIHHYIRVAKALQLTSEIQIKIDKIYPQIEKNVIVFYN